MFRHKSIIMLILVAILFIPLIGCSNPPYKMENGDPVILKNNPNPKPTSWNQLITAIYATLDDVLPYFKENQPCIDGNVILHNKLEDQGLKTAFVTINGSYDKPFLTLIAVETSDRGLVYIKIVPQSVGTKLSIDKWYYIQNAYVQKYKKIGFLPVKFAENNDYEWYLNVREKTLDAFDAGAYIDKYAEIVKINKEKLDNIEKTNDKISGYLNNTTNYMYAKKSYTFDKYTYSQRINIYNQRINRYNSYIPKFNNQVEDLKQEISIFKEQ